MEDIMLIMIILIVLQLFLIIILIGRLKNSLTRIIISLEKVAKMKGVSEPSEDKILKTFISNKEKIKAIKRYRDITGSELKEATDYVEKLLNTQEKDDENRL